MTFKRNVLRIWDKNSGFIMDVCIYAALLLLSYRMFHVNGTNIPPDTARLFAERLSALGEVISSNDSLASSLLFYLVFLIFVFKSCTLLYRWGTRDFDKSEGIEGETYLLQDREREVKWLL